MTTRRRKAPTHPDGTPVAATAPAAKRAKRGGRDGGAATPATTGGKKKATPAPPASAAQGSAASATQTSTRGGKKSGITWTIGKLRLFLAVGTYAWCWLPTYTSTYSSSFHIPTVNDDDVGDPIEAFPAPRMQGRGPAWKKVWEALQGLPAKIVEAQDPRFLPLLGEARELADFLQSREKDEQRQQCLEKAMGMETYEVGGKQQLRFHPQTMLQKVQAANALFGRKSGEGALDAEQAVQVLGYKPDEVTLPDALKAEVQALCRATDPPTVELHKEIVGGVLALFEKRRDAFLLHKEQKEAAAAAKAATEKEKEGSGKKHEHAAMRAVGSIHNRRAPAMGRVEEEGEEGEEGEGEDQLALEAMLEEEDEDGFKAMSTHLSDDPGAVVALVDGDEKGAAAAGVAAAGVAAGGRRASGSSASSVSSVSGADQINPKQHQINPKQRKRQLTQQRVQDKEKHRNRVVQGQESSNASASSKSSDLSRLIDLTVEQQEERREERKDRKEQNEKDNAFMNRMVTAVEQKNEVEADRAAWEFFEKWQRLPDNMRGKLRADIADRLGIQQQE